jgi:hypothetical protein
MSRPSIWRVGQERRVAGEQRARRHERPGERVARGVPFGEGGDEERGRQRGGDVDHLGADGQPRAPLRAGEDVVEAPRLLEVGDEEDPRRRDPAQGERSGRHVG